MKKQPYTLKTINFYRDGNQCKVTFENPKGKPMKLFYGTQPNEETVTDILGSTEEDSLEFTLSEKEGPYYYKLQEEETALALFGERLLPLNGAINVRDMGGYTTDGGRQVQWGKLYRGDQLSSLDDSDVVYLEKVKLHSIIDFRSEKEQILNPNYPLSTVKETIQCDPQSTVAEAAGEAVSFEEENKKIVKNLEAGIVAKENLNGSGTAFLKNYREFVTSEPGKQAFGRMLKFLARPEHLPTLMHCRGGKDRTGFGAALTLLLLGVNEEEIIEDYLITQKVREKRNRYKMGLYAEHTDNKAVLDYLQAMIDTRADYIQASLQAIQDEYGDVETYVIQGLGLTKEEIQQIKENFLV